MSIEVKRFCVAVAICILLRGMQSVKQVGGWFSFKETYFNFLLSR